MTELNVEYLRFRVRAYTRAEWESSNGILLEREVGLVLPDSTSSDDHAYRCKLGLGDNVPWNDKDYVALGLGEIDLSAIAAGHSLFWDSANKRWVTGLAGNGLAFSYTADTGSTADSDPTDGLIRWDNATQTSATHLYVDDVTADSGIDLSTLFGSLGSAGFVHIVHASDPSKWQVWKWSALVDGTGYWKFTVALQVNSASFADADPLRITFLPSGSGGGGSTPTGTGFRHVTGGVEDAAARLIVETDLNLSDNTTGNASTSKHGLLRKLPGGSTIYLDANGNFTSPSATGGAGWQTAYDLDFSAESSQTLSADGNYTIGGKTWTKANSANDSVAMAVTNGSGLIITPKSTSLYLGQSSRTAPYLYVDLVSLIPAFYLEMPLRIWVYVSSDNVAAAGDAVGCAIDNMSTVANTCCLYIFRRAYNGGKSLESNGAVAGSVSVFAANSALLDNSDRVMQFSLPTGRWSGASALWAGADASGWPSPSAMRPVYRNASSTGGLTSSQDIVTGLPMKLVLYAQRNGSGTALSATIKRVRIDYQST